MLCFSKSTSEKIHTSGLPPPHLQELSHFCQARIWTGYGIYETSSFWLACSQWASPLCFLKTPVFPGTLSWVRVQRLPVIIGPSWAGVWKNDPEGSTKWSDLRALWKHKGILTERVPLGDSLSAVLPRVHQTAWNRVAQGKYMRCGAKSMYIWIPGLPPSSCDNLKNLLQSQFPHPYKINKPIL